MDQGSDDERGSVIPRFSYGGGTPEVRIWKNAWLSANMYKYSYFSSISLFVFLIQQIKSYTYPTTSSCLARKENKIKSMPKSRSKSSIEGPRSQCQSLEQTRAPNEKAQRR